MTDDEHICDRMPAGGVRVERESGYIGLALWQWCLVVERVATEEDVEENHYLENSGEMIWSTVVGISHCPFCGALLESSSSGFEVPRAEYFHVDGLGWRVKIL